MACATFVSDFPTEPPRTVSSVPGSEANARQGAPDVAALDAGSAVSESPKARKDARFNLGTCPRPGGQPARERGARPIRIEFHHRSEAGEGESAFGKAALRAIASTPRDLVPFHLNERAPR